MSGADHLDRLREVHAQGVSDMRTDLQLHRLAHGCVGENDNCEKSRSHWVFRTRKDHFPELT